MKVFQEFLNIHMGLDFLNDDDHNFRFSLEIYVHNLINKYTLNILKIIRMQKGAALISNILYGSFLTICSAGVS